MSALDLRQLRLKDRTRALQAAIGGLEACAGVTGKGKSQHGRCQSATDPDFATIDDVARMEAVAPRDAAFPPVTRLLCEMAGGVFLPLPDVEAHPGPVGAGLVALVKEFGELCAAAGQGLADGSLDPDELLRIQREGVEVQSELAGFLQGIQALIDAEPVNIAAVRRAGSLR